VVPSDLDYRLQRLRAVQQWLDNAFRLPGTRLRVGWDPIIGLIPWVGDLLTAVMACAIIVEAHRARVPRLVQLRMLANVGFDLLLGSIPVAGDVADVFWKSNSRNMALLDRHVLAPGTLTFADCLFLACLIATIVVAAAIPILLLYGVARLAGRGLW
jgi:hypothetical protein